MPKVLRQYTPDFRPLDKWLAAFTTAEQARDALGRVAGKTIGNFPIGASLAPLSALDAYHDVNLAVDEPECCLLFTSFPPGSSAEDLKVLFAGFDLKECTLGSPIKFNPSGRLALIEFTSKSEAHRAFRKLAGTQHVCLSGKFTINLQLLV